MKKFLTLMGVFWLCLAPSCVLAHDQIIESYGTHSVNWEQGFLEIQVTANQSDQNIFRFLESSFLDLTSSIRIDSETTVGGLMVQDPGIKEDLLRVLDQGEIQQLESEQDGIQRLRIQVPLFGELGIAKIFYYKYFPPRATPLGAKVGQLRHKTRPRFKFNDRRKSYTGVIIDARGLDMFPCLMPQVFFRHQPLFRHDQIDLHYAIQYGMGAFSHTGELSTLNARRVGDTPLIIKAINVKGPFRSYVQISEADRNLLLDYNRQTGFIEKCKLIFII